MVTFHLFQATSNTIMLMVKDIEKDIVKKFARESGRSEKSADQNVSCTRFRN